MFWKTVMLSRLLSVCAVLTGLVALPAQAGEGTFGWVYTLDLQPKGTLEFEQRLHINQGQARGTYDLWQALSLIHI